MRMNDDLVRRLEEDNVFVSLKDIRSNIHEQNGLFFINLFAINALNNRKYIRKDFKDGILFSTPFKGYLQVGETDHLSELATTTKSNSRYEPRYAVWSIAIVVAICVLYQIFR